MKNSRPHILVVDDDELFCRLLRDYLRGKGYDVTLAHDSVSAIASLSESAASISLVILDLVMPGRDGLTTLIRIKQISDASVIMLSARSEPEDRILGLELGADDYLAKTCSAIELLARIRVQLRRPWPPYREIIQVGKLQLNLTWRRAHVSNHELCLTASEFAVLTTLAKRPGILLRRAELTLSALGRPLRPFDRCLDVHITRIRAKLAEASRFAPQIVAIRSAGYLLQIPKAIRLNSQVSIQSHSVQKSKNG